MYKEHPAFKNPGDEDGKIWRYMNFSKFVSLLDNSALFFARTDKLGDPFEGSYPKHSVKQRETLHKKWLNTLPTQLKEFFEQRPKAISEFYKSLRRCIFINSWHENEHESDAMWKLYLKNDEGIAIQSTFGRLRDCFGNETPDIYIGRVRYIDYLKDAISEENFFNPFLRKRKGFEHEREVRAIVFAYGKIEDGMPNLPSPAFPTGMPVLVDLDKLIDRIYLAPTSPKWLHELISSVSRKYNLRLKVFQTSLTDRPSF